MSEWKKGISKAGKIRTKTFSAIVTAIYPAQIKTGTGILQIDFEDKSNIGIFGIDKATITDEGVEVGGSLASFQESLEKLGYECMWGEDNGEILGFRTEPDIVGSMITMEPLEEQVVGDDSQTKKSTFWGIVTKVEKANTPQRPAATAAKLGKLSKAPKTAEAPKAKEDITNIVIDALDVPKSISELFTGLGKKYKVSELREALDTLKDQGMIDENNGKWQVL